LSVTTGALVEAIISQAEGLTDREMGEGDLVGISAEQRSREIDKYKPATLRPRLEGTA
jgi:hypothetical protein